MACRLFHIILNCPAFCGAWGERGHLYEAGHGFDCATAGCCHQIAAHSIELLAAVCTYDLNVSTSNFWLSVIVFQSFF